RRLRMWGASDYGFSSSDSPNFTITLQGSNDNVTWTDLGSTVVADANGVMAEVTATTLAPYAYHRAHVVSSGGAYAFKLAEIQFFEVAAGYSSGQSYDLAADCYSFFSKLPASTSTLSTTGAIYWYTNVADLFDGDGVNALYSADPGSTFAVDFGAGNATKVTRWEIDFLNSTAMVEWSPAGSHRHWRLRCTDALENSSSTTAAWAVEYSDDAGTWVQVATLTAAGINSITREMRLYEPGNGVLVSSAVLAAASTPVEARLVLLHQPMETVTLNTDLIAEVSRDDGTSWTAVTLAAEGAFDATTTILSGTADLSAQPTGTAMRWRVRTLNSRCQRLHGVWIQWR
ncbi:MAG: hypothetical protein AB1918_08815, partial [Pseudomonadota bacterium]